MAMTFAGIDLSFEFTGGLLRDLGQRTGFVVLASFLLSFLIIRTSARMTRSDRFPWWPGSVKTSSGLHIHHFVWGFGFLLVSGFLSLALDPVSPWREVLAAGFGAGAGLTLDEFALILYLEDVYWAKQGRTSLDAVIAAALLGGLVVVGLAPFDLQGRGDSVGLIAMTVAVIVVISGISFAKGKLLVGLVGLFLPPVSLFGAVRLARPSSPWANRWYPPGSHKLRKATERDERQTARRHTWMDRIGGAPSSDHPPLRERS
jgi:hypothetical protein